MIIYVVFGTTGEYSDRREWTVKAFSEEKKAKKLVKDATRRANEFDSDMQTDYTGTRYYYEQVEFEG
jgi:hypothetical protein